MPISWRNGARVVRNDAATPVQDVRAESTLKEDASRTAPLFKDSLARPRRQMMVTHLSTITSMPLADFNVLQHEHVSQVRCRSPTCLHPTIPL